eukprot:scaffold5018_cov147-Skeletonema_menzelii.AAC.7
MFSEDDIYLSVIFPMMMRRASSLLGHITEEMARSSLLHPSPPPRPLLILAIVLALATLH